MPQLSKSISFELIFIIKDELCNVGISMNVEIEESELKDFIKSSKKYLKEKGNRIEKVFIRKI